MTHRETLLLTCMAALCAVLAKPAIASPIYVTYTGTATGTDTNGVFGTAGTSFQSTAFTATYTYDTTQFGNAAVTVTSYRDYVQGGTTYGITDPILSSRITVAGSTYSQDSSYQGNAGVALSGSGFAAVFDEAYSSSTNYLDLAADYVSGPLTPSLNATQSFSASVLSSAYGFFDYNGERLSLSVLGIDITDVDPSQPPASVPEPGTPALLGGVVVSFVLGASRWRRAQRKGTTDVHSAFA